MLTINDSLTSIAVAYYKKHGTVEEKLKSYLYNGRVYVNSKNYEKAMDNYLCAEEYAGKCGDLRIGSNFWNLPD